MSLHPTKIPMKGRKKVKDAQPPVDAACPQCGMSGPHFIATHLVTDGLGRVVEQCPQELPTYRVRLRKVEG